LKLSSRTIPKVSRGGTSTTKTKGKEDGMTEEKQCPKCSEVLRVLLFLGVQPDGLVCQQCHIWYTDDLQPLAYVIGEEG